MKRLIALILSLSLLLTSCGSWQSTERLSESASETEEAVVEEVVSAEEADDEADTEPSEVEPETEEESEESSQVSFENLNDEDLLAYVEQTIYYTLVTDLNSDEYFVEGVTATYISKEYLAEVAYNSQSNIYFGYTLEEIEAEYEGTRYIFTLGDDGTTIVQAFEDYDTTFDEIVQNVAIGTGVILICVTVSAVAGIAGAPAVSLIFAVSAKTGTIVALESAALSGVITAAITGFTTQDVETTLKAAALSASDGFKWGAITGVIAGGITEYLTLHKATLAGLTLDEAAILQQTTKWSTETLAQIRSLEEGQYYYSLGLTEVEINGQTALIQAIDLEYVSVVNGQTVTNLERMRMGYAAVDATGTSYELHHIGQTVDSSLAVLTNAQHTGEYYSLLHDTTIDGVHSLLSASEWSSQRSATWKALAEVLAPVA